MDERGGEENEEGNETYGLNHGAVEQELQAQKEGAAMRDETKIFTPIASPKKEKRERKKRLLICNRFHKICTCASYVYVC